MMAPPDDERAGAHESGPEADRLGIVKQHDVARAHAGGQFAPVPA
jgi:hypothetical protein